MKKFMKEFKEFINRGNVMDMAVGIIIGGAFTSIVTALVDNIVNPLLQSIGASGAEGDFTSALVVTLNGQVINFGAFISAIINFLIMAFILFTIIKAMNTAAEKLGPKKEEEAPTTKKCPYCMTEIHIDATRCPHCTSELAYVKEE